MEQTTYTFKKGDSPLVATAIHDGHLTRPEIQYIFNLTEDDRLREEDPFTAKWVESFDNQIIVHHSRFETDVNRPRNKAVYMQPEDAWGLKVWKNELPREIAAGSLEVYDAFYRDVRLYFDDLFLRHKNIVVYDIHSYNHRREGANIEANAEENPEVNIGTKNLDHAKWHGLVNDLITNFRSFDYDGRSLDVRENVKFKGGYFGQWLYENYGNNICPVSIEFKKFFMDEWTGEPFEKEIKLIGQLIRDSKRTAQEALEKLNF